MSAKEYLILTRDVATVTIPEGAIGSLAKVKKSLFIKL